MSLGYRLRAAVVCAACGLSGCAQTITTYTEPHAYYMIGEDGGFAVYVEETQYVYALGSETVTVYVFYVDGQRYTCDGTEDDCVRAYQKVLTRAGNAEAGGGMADEYTVPGTGTAG